MIRRLYEKHQQKFNYLLVGIWNTIFGYGAFVTLYFLLSARVHYLILLVMANILSITNAYAGYKIFVFKTKGNYLQEYGRFYVVYGVSLAANMVYLPLCVELFRIIPPVAQAGWIFINVIFSYLGHKHYSFAGR